MTAIAAMIAVMDMLAIIRGTDNLTTELTENLLIIETLKLMLALFGGLLRVAATLSSHTGSPLAAHRLPTRIRYGAYAVPTQGDS